MSTDTIWLIALVLVLTQLRSAEERFIARPQKGLRRWEACTTVLSVSGYAFDFPKPSDPVMLR